MIPIDKTLSGRKANLLTYFRERAQESLRVVRATYGNSQYKKQAAAVNKALTQTCDAIVTTLKQSATRENWSNEETLKCVLMIIYAHYVVMLEARNEVWPYEYMAFSRRIGELWDPFCQLCFYYPVRAITLFVPPLFSEVKQSLSKEIEDYIDGLSITDDQKNGLKHYYNKVWGLVTSGEIKLELDLHFQAGTEKVVADFKSGFGSNEKGNTNRLLLVGTIYRNLEENYKCLLLVRSPEDSNNNYFRTLRNSGVWEAYCGDEAYAKMKEYSGFDIKRWIGSNIKWEDDFKTETMDQFRAARIDQYLKGVTDRPRSRN
jgi:hypothetical protein